MWHDDGLIFFWLKKVTSVDDTAIISYVNKTLINVYNMCVCIYIFTYGISHNMTLSLQQTTELLAQWHSITSQMWIYIYIHTHTHMIFHIISHFHYSNKRTTCPLTQHIIPHEPLRKTQISHYRNWFMNLPWYHELQKDTYIYACMHASKQVYLTQIRIMWLKKISEYWNAHYIYGGAYHVVTTLQITLTTTVLIEEY